MIKKTNEREILVFCEWWIGLSVIYLWVLSWSKNRFFLIPRMPLVFLCQADLINWSDTIKNNTAALLSLKISETLYWYVAYFLRFNPILPLSIWKKYIVAHKFQWKARKKCQPDCCVASNFCQLSDNCVQFGGDWASLSRDSFVIFNTDAVLLSFIAQCNSIVWFYF